MGGSHFPPKAFSLPSVWSYRRGGAGKGRGSFLDTIGELLPPPRAPWEFSHVSGPHLTLTERQQHLSNLCIALATSLCKHSVKAVVAKSFREQLG